jgi:hypothetical protein
MKLIDDINSDTWIVLGPHRSLLVLLDGLRFCGVEGNSIHLNFQNGNTIRIPYGDSDSDNKLSAQCKADYLRIIRQIESWEDNL